MTWPPLTVCRVFVIDKHGKLAYRHVGYDPTLPETLNWQANELLK